MVFNNSILLGAAGQSGAATFDPTTIGNSVWLDGSADYLTRTPSSAGNRTRWTLAWWFQLNAIATDMTFFSANVGSNDFFIRMDANSSSSITIVDDSASMNMNTTPVQRDIGWYHCIISYDSNQTIASDRVRIYINGEQQSLTAGSAAEPSSGGETYWNNAQANEIGRRSRTSSSYVNAYMTQICFLNADSIQNGDVAVTDFLDTFTFGTNGSQVIPKKDSEIAALATTAGGNSFCLDFANSSDLGNDISSNNNDFTPNSMAAANQSENTPSLVYPVVNALRPAISGKTFSEGNLKVSSTSGFGQGNVLTTFPLSKGAKWYWEVIDAAAAANQTYGIAKADAEASANGLGNDAKSWAFYNNQYRHSGNVGAVPDSPTNTGTRYMFAVDVDAGKFWMGNDGTWWKPVGGSTAGDPAAGTNPAFTDTDIAEGDTFPAIDLWSSDSATFVFDEDDFAHTIPTGFNYLNSSNLTAPDYQGIDYFDATLYEGNGIGQRVGDFIPFTDVGTISQSVAFNKADSDKLTIASSVSTSPTNVQKKTVSCWLKPLEAKENWIIVGDAGSDNSERIYGSSTGQINYLTRDGSNSNAHVQTSGAFLNDPSQWVHVVVALDYTDGSTEADRVKIYVNGVRQTSLSATTYPANNMTAQAYINKASTDQIIGKHPSDSGAAAFSNMYYAEYFMVDGHQLDASVFGQLDTSTNRWVAKASSTVTTAIGALSGGFGNCGFYLDFSNTSDYGEDDSGNNRDWTESGVLDATNQFADTPSSNFATIDPIMSNGATPVTLSKGNLTGVRSSSGFQQAYSSFSGFRMQENTGIYFAEVLMGADSSNFSVGVLSGDPPSSTNRYLGQDSNTYGYAYDSGNKVNDGTGASYGATYTSGDVIGIEIDTDTGSINFHKNGADQGQAFTAVPGPYSFAFDTESGGGPNTFNFGQQMTLGGASTTFNAAAGGRFKHTPPTGAKALNQDNLDDVASKLTAWAWIKNRDATDSHILVDRVRGVGEVLHSDATDLEATEPNTVQRFLQRGVQVGNDVQVNTANESYVLWQWLVGEAATTTTINASSTTPTNSIASTVAAADAGHFSVVGYQGNSTNGATVAHSLGGEPELIFFRGREGSGASSFLWRVFSTAGGAGKYLRLNDSTALQDDTGYLNNTLPGSVVFTLGTDGDVNNSSYTYVAYCFRSVPGVCKVGTYTGNGNNDGPYISVGFLPKYVLVKSTTANRNWNTLDTARNPTNIASPFVLLPNSTAVDTAGQIGAFDILADGFKPRDTAANSNASGETYIYMAIADIGGNGTLPPIYGR